MIALTPDAATAVERSLLEHPNAATAAYYVKNAEAVDGLNAKANDQSLPSKARIEAFEQLQLGYPDAAFLESLKLISDRDETVAAMAASDIAGALAMSNHTMTMTEMTPAETFVMSQFEQGRQALRSALADERLPVRSIAAKTLSSLTDKPALDAIAAAAKTGKLGELEAVNYFGLANPDIGAAYLVPYVDSGKGRALSAAVSYLATNREYQATIKDKVFLNPSADTGARTAAADKLGQYDPAFTSYGLAVTKDPKIPSALYAKVLEGYADRFEVVGKVDPTQAKPFNEAVGRFADMFPENAAKASVIQQRVNDLAQ